MSFLNKTVIVTGSSSGIGASCAKLFTKEGADVVMVGRNEAKLSNVAETCTKLGRKPLVLKADVSKDEDVKQIVNKTIEKYGKIDVLVNNAGITASAKLIDENLVSVYDKVINNNLRSVVMLTNLAAPYLIKTKGNIVNISSVAGSSTLARITYGNLAYCVSKAGLDHFSRVSALELAPHGVRVNIVSPGPVETDFGKNAGLTAILDSETRRNITALKIISEPEEVADLIAYLAGDKAKSITGANYVIDGGTLIM